MNSNRTYFTLYLNKHFSLALLLMSVMLLSQATYAASEKVSVSFGKLSQQINIVERKNFLANKQQNGPKSANKTTLKASPKTTRLTGETRNNDTIVSSTETYQFGIFNAHSALLTDDDYDGYYHGFSITFDADYLRYDQYDTALVYAELYLRKNGGPWLHYFTTQNFTIHSDTPDDAYEVVTNLRDGYRSDNYDVLIDLYEVGYTDIVATYSSDDNNALYALPLESANYDISQPDVVVISNSSEGYGGGSFSWLLLLSGFTLLIRRFNFISV